MGSAIGCIVQRYKIFCLCKGKKNVLLPVNWDRQWFQDGIIVASMVQWLNGEVKTHSEILVFVKSRFRKLNKQFFFGSVVSLVLYFLVFLCYVCFVFSIFVVSLV